MGKLKAYIIKKLGGYTAEEYKSATSIRAPKIHEITRMELVDVKAETEISRVDYEHMDEELSRIPKICKKCKCSTCAVAW